MDLLAGGAAADPAAAEVNISSDASPRLEAGGGEEDSSMDFAASIEKVKDVSKLDFMILSGAMRKTLHRTSPTPHRWVPQHWMKQEF